MVCLRHLAAVTVLACVLSGHEAAAQEQPSFEVRFHAAKATLQEYQDKVADWERGSSMAMAMVVLLAGLGAVTMILQGIRRPWVPIATVVAGALVSSVTVINNSVSRGDYKTLSSRAAEGRRLLRSANDLLALQTASPQDNEEILKEVQRRLISLSQLESDTRSGVSSASFTIPGIEVVALAMPSQCACSGNRSEPGFQYVCATATARSLTEARQLAFDHALGQAAQQLQNKASQRTAGSQPSLAYLRNVATQADSCTSRTEAGFVFMVWLKIPLSLVSDRAQMAFSPAPGAKTVRLRLDTIKVIQDGSNGSTGWIFDVLVGGKVLFSLPNRSYSDQPKANAYQVALSNPQAAGEVTVTTAKPAEIQVSARRSFGGDRATGVGVLNTDKGSLAVFVKNAETEKKGSFELHFSVSPGISRF